MATAESEEKHTLTLLWRIENVSLWEQIYSLIKSPVFRPRVLEENRFLLYIDRTFNYLYLAFSIQNRSLDFPIDCEWSFIGRNGSPLVSGTERNRTLKQFKPLSLPSCPTKENVCHTMKTSFIPHDTLTLRVRVWKSCGNLSNNELISLTSRFEASENSFLWTVPEFSSLKLNQEVTTPLTFEFFNGSSTFQLKFSLRGVSLENAITNFQLTAVSITSPTLVYMKVYVLGYEQKSVKKERKYFSGKSQGADIFPEFVSRKELLNRKSDCLRNDVLNIRCESEAINCYPNSSIQKSDHGFSNPEVNTSNDNHTFLDACCQTTEQSVEHLDFSLQREDSLAYLGKDLLSLYQDQKLTDFELRSGDVSFPVHKNILSARSAVFSAMFSTNMKESVYNWQDVPDLDVHTLNRMLTFLYGGTVEPQLQWESAAKLYYAADKYQVQSLKQQCSFILRSNISVSNVSDILTLADRHQDKELTSFIHEFVLNNYDEVMQSEEWEKFLETNSYLTGKTMLQLYKIKLQTKLL